MNDYARSVRIGLAAVCCAALFRLLGPGLPGFSLSPAKKANIAAFALYLETGRDVRFSPSLEADLWYPSESAVPSFAFRLPEFSDAPVPEVLNQAGVEADLPALLERPLSWNLFGDTPTVLILSTHSTESYTKKGETYKESASWRTLDENYNMLSIGAEVGRLLEEAGIRVLRDTALHDYPSYNGSYGHARAATEAILAENPGILLVLDLHRDASDAAFGQLRTAVDLPEGATARMMPVLGTNHPHWQDNLSLALKLMAQLEAQAPGITRPLLLRRSTFNQDLSPGALLIEMGAAGNSHPEALRAAKHLAEAIIALARGTA